MMKILVKHFFSLERSYADRLYYSQRPYTQGIGFLGFLLSTAFNWFDKYWDFYLYKLKYSSYDCRSVALIKSL